ncbi:MULTISPECIES: phage tail tape measure protein [Streptomyces]|uniref:Phage tail protein n=1 Tax=Streptomyces dengpaensis TaxID=2049881 RepID=A0ABM6SVH8_9ACTN|nr:MULTISPECIES: phage tail tape measure protein [Streptomyces]AVH58659.1 phage tail protein [Streptomyces dengpaensis]PIB11280.1 hypothetical protein B1C81_05555 [Streptomyces sp. HG99]
MSDVSLVFNLVARDNTGQTLEKVREKFDAAAAGIGAGVAAALGVGIAANLDMEAANDKLAAQLGVGPAKAAELSKVSAKVYEGAWGESTAEVNDAIKNVYMNIGDTSKAQGGLEGATVKVMALSDAFDQDLTASTYAAGQMVKTGMAKNFDEAMDLLTVGFQKGADKSGDFLDTFNEYSTQFRKLGIDGPQAIGLISQGLKGGARDADIVADAFKEFGIRAIDGSKTTADGFKLIGLSADDMSKKIAAGGPGANKALDETLDRLRAMKDPVKQNAAGVALFGTQWEDMGKAMMSLDPSKAADSLGKVGGAADKMAKTLGDNPKAAIESFKRKVVGDLSEIAGHFIKFAMENQGVFEPLAYAIGGIAAVVLTVKAGMMAWAAAQAAWSAATAVATAAQWLWNSALFASPITWIIVGIVALIAIIVIIATKTTWFQTIWKVAWGAIKTAVSASWSFIRDKVFGPIGRFFTQTIPRWSGMVRDAVVGAWNSTKNKVQSVVGGMLSWVRGKWDGFIGFFRGLPGKIGRATSGMFNGVKNAFRSAINWVIGKWNNFGFSIGGGSFMGKSLPRVTIGTPNIPYLAKGGLITRGGMAMVGERGPEVLSLPRGAGVAPLPVGGAGTRVDVYLHVDADDAYLKRRIRKMVSVEGRGSVNALFE